jgi:arabinose-5-phosphate isomerase
MNIENYLVHENQTVEEAVAVIKRSLAKCCVVVNDERKVLGVFSDGDVLQAILQGIDLHTPLRSLLTGNFLSLHERDMEKATRLFKDKGITLLPVVDLHYTISDVITLQDVLHFIEI